MLVVGWNTTTEEAWVLDHQILPGSPEDADVWKLLDAERARTYGGRTVERVHVDSGFMPSQVYAYCWPRQRDGVFAVKGYAARPFVSAPRLPEKGPKGRKCLLLLVGTDEAKAITMARLGSSSGPGAIHFPNAAWCSTEFVAQLTSEQRQQVRYKGITVTRWVQIRERNEALDLLVYALHAARWLKPAR